MRRKRVSQTWSSCLPRQGQPMRLFKLDFALAAFQCVFFALMLTLFCCSVQASPDTKAELAKLKKEIDDPKAAIADRKELNSYLSRLNAIILKNKNLADAFYLQGVVYEKLDDKAKAIASLDQCLKLDPKHGNAHWYRGILFFGKDFGKAIDDFDAAIANGSAKPAVYSNRGAAYVQVDQKKKALQDFDTALNMAPDQTYTRMMRAELNQELGHSEDAIKDCDLVFADKRVVESDVGWLHKIKGSALYSIAKYEDSVSEMTRAADALKGEEKAKAIFLRGAAYHKLGKDDLADADIALARKLGFVPHAQSASMPVDKVAHLEGAENQAKLEAAITPLIAAAKKTLPAAKTKYLKGLPAGFVFFVTVKLKDAAKSEQVFVHVNSWHEDKIDGTLANHVNLLSYHEGDKIQVLEKDILDWTIMGPDGKEEGNVVGKFIDNWKK